MFVIISSKFLLSGRQVSLLMPYDLIIIMHSYSFLLRDKYYMASGFDS